MSHFDPSTSEFSSLPRQEQARIYRQHFGWTVEGVAEEFGVSDTTVKRWTTPGMGQRHREREKMRQRAKRSAA